MRTHPLGIICLTKSLEDTFHTAMEFSCLTHPDPRCVVACCIATALIRGILRGEVTSEVHIDAIIDRAFGWVKTWAHKRADRIKAKTTETIQIPSFDRLEFQKHVIHPQTFQELQLDDAHAMGYVYKALGAAVVCLRRAISQDAAHIFDRSSSESRLRLFHQLIQELVMEGGDADTNACIAGALLGAWVGYTALPPQWRDGLRQKKWLLGKAEALCGVVVGGSSRKGRGHYNYKGSLDPDTRIDGGANIYS
ncbi:hypothetical protein VTN77DRAFT_1419 [Rasamsonia byssochlamydoides]|uniref:uncharacterized protein n=1 Tax=Rasamsonia byssochlamydoides TaxID=89139 RepID=UPI003743F666